MGARKKKKDPAIYLPPTPRSRSALRPLEQGRKRNEYEKKISAPVAENIILVNDLRG